MHLHGADEHVVGAVVGRRSGIGVTRSSPVRGPMVSASRTTTHPPRVFHVVTERIGSRFIAARVRHGRAEGGQPEAAGLAVEQGGEHTG
jgi:hypothetical protein